jgi:tetratricopeptide (TPR) repeat protein
VTRLWARGIEVRIVLGALLVAPGASAQDADLTEVRAHDRALQLFSDGKTAYKGGDLRTAIKDLEAAYELEPVAVLLYNLARAYEGIGELEKAVSAYERFLVAQPNAEDRGAIQTRVATLKRQIEDQAQRHAAYPPPEPRPEATAIAHSTSIVPIVILTTGGAGLLLGGAFGGLALAQNDTQNAQTTSQLDGRSAHDRASSFAVASDVGLIAGAMLVAVGAAWIVLDKTHAKAQSGARVPFVVRF